MIALKQKEASIPKRSKWQEIIKLGAEINKIVTKKTIQGIIEMKNLFFEKNQQDRQTLIQTKRQRICKLTKSKRGEPNNRHQGSPKHH